MLSIRQTEDDVQEIKGILLIPEIRVWTRDSGPDYYDVCESFQEAHRRV